MSAATMQRQAVGVWMAKRLDARTVIARYEGLLDPDRKPPPAGRGVEALYRTEAFWVGVLTVRKAELLLAPDGEFDQLSRQVRDLERIAQHARTGCDVTWLPEFRRWRAGRMTRLFQLAAAAAA